MPQAINRSLMGQMGATPTGPGTVYAAMLKSRANNQDRVSRVNKSEKMRLQKVKKVMDRNSRHCQWECDQQMEQLRKSLVRLEAFRRVLRDDFPVNKLMPRHKRDKPGDTNNNGSVTVTAADKSRFRSDSRRASGDENFKLESKSSANFNPVSEDVMPSAKERAQNRSQATLDGNDNNNGNNMKSPLHGKESYNTNKHEEGKNYNRTNTKQVIFIQPDKTKPEALRGKESARKTRTEDVRRSIININEKGHHGVKVDGRCQEDRREESVTSSKARTGTQIIGASLDPRKQLRMELRMERQKKMEEKIVWRGFDMITLGSEVRRKMKAMDPKRNRRRFQGEMAAYSRRQNERIIADSKVKFDSQVMSEGGAIGGDDPTSTPTDGPTNTPRDGPTNTPRDGPTNTPTDRLTNAPKPTESLETGGKRDEQKETNSEAGILQISFNPLLHKIPL